MNDEIVEEKKNNTNKILIAIIIILILALGGLTYYTFLVRDKKVDKPNPVVEPTKPVVKTTNPVVDPTKPVENDKEDSVKVENKYYEEIKTDEIIVENIFHDKDKGDYIFNDIMVDTLSADVKAYYGYRKILPSEIKKTLCSEFDSSEKVTIGNFQLYCGYPGAENPQYSCDSSTDGWKCEYTDAFEEETLRNNVNMIFGSNTYTSVDYIAHLFVNTYPYYYDKNTEKYYVKGYAGGGGFAYEAISNFISEVEDGDYIYIYEDLNIKWHIEPKNDDIKVKLKHTFKKDADNKFYYYSITVEK